MVDYCSRGMARLNWQEYRTERLELIRKGWTVQSEHIGICTLTRRGERRTIIITRRVLG